MFERLQKAEQRYLEITEQLKNPNIINDYEKVKILSKEQSDLAEIVKKYQEYQKNQSDLKQAQSLLNDTEMKNFAEEEEKRLSLIETKLYHELELLLVNQDENDAKNVMMEIRGAAGGDEANIFAGDLFRMYVSYAEKNNWKVEVINEVTGTSGGYAQIEFLIKGKNAYARLKYESGSHRVQRVPTTEAQGRLHTSTATVLVMPEVEAVNFELKESDIKMDVYHSSGAGGQSVNTSNSAVRLTHLPTGLAVTCQTERSQLKNRTRALKLLKVKLNELWTGAHEIEVGAERKIKIGTGARSEKIRTYNYPQNRVTDHRINFSIIELDRVMNGHLDPIIDALRTEDLKSIQNNEKNFKA